MPNEQPDEELFAHTAAVSRYIWASTIDDRRIFPIALLGLALKGYLRIIDAERFHLVKVLNPQQLEPLSPEERQLLAVLFKGKDDIEVSNQHSKTRTRLDKAQRQVQQMVQRQGGVQRSEQVLRNWWIRSLCLLVVSFVLTGLLGVYLKGNPVVFILGTGFFVVGCILVIISLPNWQRVSNHASADRSPGILSVILMLAGIIFAGGGLLVTYHVTPLLALCNVAILTVFAFAYLSAIKHIREGNTEYQALIYLRASLLGKSAETIPLETTPDEVLRTFERYLPYAMALDVELVWAKRLEAHLEMLGKMLMYCPQWYENPGTQLGGLVKIVKTVSDRFVGDVELAIQPFGFR